MLISRHPYRLLPRNTTTSGFIWYLEKLYGTSLAKTNLLSSGDLSADIILLPPSPDHVASSKFEASRS